MKQFIKTTIREFLNENMNNGLINTFLSYLSVKNINTKNAFVNENIYLYINKNYIGTIRFYIDSDWVVIDNIEINEDLRGKGIGFYIYESLYKASKDNNMRGLGSSLYSKEISQKRSRFATNVLNKLLNKYGGEMLDVSDYITNENIDEDVYDYLIDGSGHIIKRKV
jgi:hypothetical protein